MSHQPGKDTGIHHGSLQPVDDWVSRQHQCKDHHADAGTDNVQDTTENPEDYSLFPDFLDELTGQEKYKVQNEADYAQGDKEADKVFPVSAGQEGEDSRQQVVG